MTRIRTIEARLVVACGLAAALVGAPRGAAGADPAAEHGADMSTTDFVRHAAQGGMAEVQLGKMAAERAESQAVKDFGQRMVTDHSKANQELTALAQKESIDLPKELDPKHRSLAERLSTLQGEAFDRAYMQAMAEDHAHDVATFERYARNGDDEEVKDWAAKTLPTLREHRQLAERTSRTTRMGAADGGGAPAQKRAGAR